MRTTLTALVIVVALGIRVAAQSPAPSASVREEKGTYIVTASFSVRESAEIARAVLTDYERLPKFMPNVVTSRVLARDAGKVTVEQEIDGRMMMFSKRIHLMLDIREAASLIQFTDVCKKYFSIYDGEWRLGRSGDDTTVGYRLTAKPTFAVPGFVLSRMMKRDAERLMAALSAEIASRARR